MGVLVCYDDFTYDVINDYHLDYLLGKGCIIGYDTSGNWVKTEDLVPERRTENDDSPTTRRARLLRKAN